MKKLILLFTIFFILSCKDSIQLKDYGKVENFTLVNQDNQKIEFYSLKGKPILLFFGYTHCPDYCPITLSKLTKIYKKLPEEQKPYIVLITVDPERDTPDVLKNYIKKFDGEIIALTGSTEEIQEIAKKLGVYIRIEKKMDHIHVEHNTSTFFLDKDFKIRYIFSFREPEETYFKVFNSYF
ncbi:MAG: SCO family protein [Leptospiraceae bacterium]|nr:MAG: SCO family protein [Leptospiraceae bacterium]